MALEGNIPHLINGVSRQVDAMRLPTHVNEQINRLSHPATGNQRRPGSNHIGQIGWSYSGDMFYHAINRDSVERYHILIADGDLKVYDKNGAAKTVAFPDGKAYLASASPISMFAAATSADYTYIVNKDVVVQMDPSTTTVALPSEALVYCRACNFTRTYTIRIDGNIVAQYTTGDGTDDSRVYQQWEQEAVSPLNLAKTLFWGSLVNDGGTVHYGVTVSGGNISYATQATDINGWNRFDADGSRYADISGDNTYSESVITTRLIDNLPFSQWDIKRYGSVLHIKKRDGTPFAISVETDISADKDSILVIKDTVQTFADLPNRGPIGFRVKVTGTPTTEYDDYWVKITKANNNNSNDAIVWQECPGPNVAIGFDAATMPHILVRESDSTFTFKRATWAQRKVGDLDTSENPSFVGTKINDVLFNRARITFLSSESVVMTRASEFFDFWRTTMTAILDDDPIDVSGTSDNVSIFKHGVSFNEDLYLFSDQTIHRLTAGDILSPKNVALPTAVKAQVNVNVPPVATARSILFAGSSLMYGDIREAFIAPDTDEVINVSVSDHCTDYIPKDIKSIVTNDSLNMAVVLGTGNTLYVYQYFWGGTEKLQAAWHKWTFDGVDNFVGAAFFDDELHVLTRRGSAISLERFNCAAEQFDPNKDWAIRIDRRVLSTSLGAPTGTPNRTYTLPYTVPANIKAYIWGGDMHGLPLTVVSYSDNTVTLQGNTSIYTVVFGIPFTSTLEISRIYLRETRGQRDVVINNEDLRLLRVFFHVDKTAYSKAYVQTYAGGPIFSSEYSAFTINDAMFNVNRIYLNRGRFSLPIKGKAQRVRIWLENDTHLPDTITGLEWLGEFDQRGQRV